jgi:uncharacterized protein YggE
MERKLQITGKGRLALTPDIILISFSVKAHEWEYEKSITRLNDKIEQLRQILEVNKIERKLLKTKDFNVRRDTNYNKKIDKYEFNGFNASHSLELELPLNQNLINVLLGKIAGTMEDLEFQISFGVKDTTTYKQQLLKNAIQKAKESAAIIAEASGVQLREIMDIDCTVREIEIRSRNYDYRVYEQEKMLYEAAPTPDFEPDDIDVSESVTITWRIE